MFKKTFTMAMSIAVLLCLAACGPKDEPAASIPPAEITDQAEEFSKPLVPLENREGEDVESPYYRITTVDGELCYEVQVAGEEEPTQIPIDSVIYIVGDSSECKLEKVNFSYTPEGGETESIEQYRIYATSNTASLTGGEEPAEDGSGEDEVPSETEAPPENEAQENAVDTGSETEVPAASSAETREVVQPETAEPET